MKVEGSEPRDWDEVWKQIAAVLPYAEIGEDLDGQLVIYTGETLQKLEGRESVEFIIPWHIGQPRYRNKK